MKLPSSWHYLYLASLIYDYLLEPKCPPEDLLELLLLEEERVDGAEPPKLREGAELKLRRLELLLPKERGAEEERRELFEGENVRLGIDERLLPKLRCILLGRPTVVRVLLLRSLPNER